MAVDIEISQQDIDYAKTFVTQFLSDKMPDADFSEGSGLQDLVVRSSAYTFAFLRKEITKVKTLRSLQQLDTLESDEEVDEAVDDIISNFFINRGDGTKSLLVATIVLSQSVDFFIDTNTSFNRDGTHIFFAIAPISFNKEDLIERITANGQVTYEADVILQAADVGPEYDVDSGNFLSWDAFSPYIVSVRNDSKASGGEPVETNQEYIDRSNDAITVRNLINPKSIRTVLLEKFKDISLKDVTTIGYGDPEMLRDKVNTYVTWTDINIVHIGNHQDVYLSLPLLEDQELEGVTQTETYIGEPDRPGSLQLPDYPLYKITDVQDASTGESLQYTLFIRNSNLYYTKEQEAFVVLVSGENGRNIKVIYDTITGFDVIHTYLRDPDERITLANTLARAVVPVYVEVNVPYTKIQGTPDLDTEAASQTVIDYINSFNNTDIINVDSLLKEIHSNYGSQIIVQAPLSLKGTVIYPNGMSKVFYSENFLTVPEFPSLGVTNRVSGYFTSTKYVTFTERNV